MHFPLLSRSLFIMVPHLHLQLWYDGMILGSKSQVTLSYLLAGALGLAARRSTYDFDNICHQPSAINLIRQMIHIERDCAVKFSTFPLALVIHQKVLYNKNILNSGKWRFFVLWL